MATLLELVTDLNDLLNDPDDVQATAESKVLGINYGIRATWPKLYRTERDETLTIADDTWEYAIPAAIASNTKLLMVEIATDGVSGRYQPVRDFHIVPGLTDPIIVFDTARLPGDIDSQIRLTVARQLSELAVDADVYDGPTGSEELPVLYAYGRLMGRRLDDRLDHRRYPTVSSNAGQVTADTIMTASQFAFAQFELLLERFAMPLPVEVAG